VTLDPTLYDAAANDVNDAINAGTMNVPTDGTPTTIDLGNLQDILNSELGFGGEEAAGEEEAGEEVGEEAGEEGPEEGEELGEIDGQQVTWETVAFCRAVVKVYGMDGNIETEESVTEETTQSGTLGEIDGKPVTAETVAFCRLVVQVHGMGEEGEEAGDQMGPTSLLQTQQSAKHKFM